MIWLEDGQASLFAQDTQYGKMSPEHSVQTKERISKPSLKNSAKSTGGISLFLDLTSGQETGLSWEMDSPWLGAFTMQKIGVFPKEEREYVLSQILEAEPPEKYSLSARACQGILNRAENRGKILPEILRTALTATISKAQE